MAQVSAQPATAHRQTAYRVAALVATLMLGACSGTSDLLSDSSLLSSDEPKAATQTAQSDSELDKATEYWSKEYQKKPADRTAALSYARNLKAQGNKRLALAVLQNAFVLHGKDTEIAGEFGRSALEFEHLTAAAQALQVADVAERPDWKVISARGTVLAKQGQHKAAIPYYERALALAPDQPSVLNNLAMANAMSGDAAKAEEILRRVATKDGAPSKVNQNLALVLGLQGKYDESKAAGAATTSTDVAAANTDYLRRMVRLDPKAAPKPVAPATQIAGATDAFKPATLDNKAPGGWATAVTASAETPGLKGSKR